MKFKENKHIKITGNGQAKTTSQHIISTKSYSDTLRLMQILIDEGLV